MADVLLNILKQMLSAFDCEKLVTTSAENVLKDLLRKTRKQLPQVNAYCLAKAVQVYKKLKYLVGLIITKVREFFTKFKTMVKKGFANWKRWFGYMYEELKVIVMTLDLCSVYFKKSGMDVELEEPFPGKIVKIFDLVYGFYELLDKVGQVPLVVVEVSCKVIVFYCKNGFENTPMRKEAFFDDFPETERKMVEVLCFSLETLWLLLEKNKLI